MEQQVVQDGEHDHGVEVAYTAAQEGGTLPILPTSSRAGMSQIDA